MLEEPTNNYYVYQITLNTLEPERRATCVLLSSVMNNDWEKVTERNQEEEVVIIVCLVQNVLDQNCLAMGLKLQRVQENPKSN